MSILRLQGVRRELGSLVVLEGLEVALAHGERVGLVGPNGAGKTTLLRLCAGLDEPDAGSVERRRGLRIGFLHQEAHLDPAFLAAPDLRTAVRRGAAVLEALEARLAAAEAEGRTSEPEYAELRHEFEVLGGYELDLRVERTLSGLGFARADWGRPPTTLSGGEQTRAMLARLVVADPDLLLLDEPTSGVDLKTRDDILHLLADLNADGITILLTTHELNTVAAHLPWVVCVNRGVVAEGDPDEIFTPEILGRTYGASLRVVRQDGLVLVADAAPHRLRDALRHRHGDVEHAHHEHRPGDHDHDDPEPAARP